MAVIQAKKRKVYSVINLYELNMYIKTFTTKVDVGAEKVREWR